ncbi:tetratricopeptide repeat protein [Neolewinella persica]|uniref:tetratricopeptide repeat protein n=1 Tax=Neolewinella persica TaxID=70998 RepID=UPI00037E769B|nr:tetratricopeptide repeat protein [Neolewinella persica]
MTEKLEDPNLSEEDKDAIVGAFVRHQENERLRKHWETLLKEKHQVSRKATPPKRSATLRKLFLPVLAIAATLLLLLVFLPDLMAKNGEQMLAANLSEISIEGVRSESTTTVDSLRDQVRTTYLAGDFSTAATTGERLLSLPSASTEDQLNLGVAHLRAGNYAQASQYFTGLIDPPGNFTTEARYYLGLSLLSSGNTKAGLEELQKIRETDGGSIYQKAQALIDASW